MGLFSAICHAFALSPFDQATHDQLMKDYGIEPYTAADIEQMNREEDQAYVSAVHAHAHRESWYTDEGSTLNWQETVIDLHGNKHIIASGSHYVGFSGFGQSNEIEKVYQGEVIEEKYIPVYKRLQG